MLSARGLAVGISTLALAAAIGTIGYADIKQVKLYPDKKGTVADLQPMSKFCGTKPIKVALADGWGGNYWRHITRAEFEDEAAKSRKAPPAESKESVASSSPANGNARRDVDDVVNAEVEEQVREVEE